MSNLPEILSKARGYIKNMKKPLGIIIKDLTQFEKSLEASNARILERNN